MQNLTSVLPLIILFLYYVAFAVLHAAYIKVAADKLRGMRVAWRDAFKIAMGLMAAVLIFRSVMLEAGFAVSTALLIAFSVVLHLSVGGWFLGKRVLTQNNEPAGWVSGVLVSGLAYVFLAATIIVANLVHKQ
jgi:hypothetical protein